MHIYVDKDILYIYIYIEREREREDFLLWEAKILIKDLGLILTGIKLNFRLIYIYIYVCVNVLRIFLATYKYLTINT
jgi:hypothetical protein